MAPTGNTVDYAMRFYDAGLKSPVYGYAEKAGARRKLIAGDFAQSAARAMTCMINARRARCPVPITALAECR